jgi:hypothetical protein
MTLPQQKHKLSWRWLLVWTLFIFAGGIAAGPTLTDQAFEIIERASSFLGKNASRLPKWLRPAAPSVTPVPTQRTAIAPPSPTLPTEIRKARAPEGQGQSSVIVVQPLAPRAEKPAGAVVPRAPTPTRAGPAARAQAEVALAETPAVRPQHAKGSAKAPSAAGPSTGAKKKGKSHDPFEAGAEGGGEPPAAKVKAEPAPKPAAAKSSDSLDNLMADVVTENKGKGKKRESKDIDAMLKDVQKGGSEPAPKREAPPPPPQLTPADISKAMVVVKTRSNDCGQRFGQKGVADLKLTVGKNGKVTDVRVGGKLGNTPIANCIEKAARAASFPPNAGLRFDYRIDVH